jgi:hypothetical protein
MHFLPVFPIFLGLHPGSVIICTDPDPSTNKQNTEEEKSLDFYSFVTSLLVILEL